MKQLKWDYDLATAYWAARVPPEVPANPRQQYDGGDRTLSTVTWSKYILAAEFPPYSFAAQSNQLRPSPANIVRALKEKLVLEALVLVLGWGEMTHSTTAIYSKPIQIMEGVLLQTIKLTREQEKVEAAWELLRGDLRWSSEIASRWLHFVARSLGYESNPPAPFDREVVVERVWPRFKATVAAKRTARDPVLQEWSDNTNSWAAYNRYMTALNVWANLKRWTTTQLETTLAAEHGG